MKIRKASRANPSGWPGSNARRDCRARAWTQQRLMLQHGVDPLRDEFGRKGAGGDLNSRRIHVPRAEAAWPASIY